MERQSVLDFWGDSEVQVTQLNMGAGNGKRCNDSSCDARLSHANQSGFCRSCWGKFMNARIRKAKREMKE